MSEWQNLMPKEVQRNLNKNNTLKRLGGGAAPKCFLTDRQPKTACEMFRFRLHLPPPVCLSPQPCISSGGRKVCRKSQAGLPLYAIWNMVWYGSWNKAWYGMESEIWYGHTSKKLEILEIYLRQLFGYSAKCFDGSPEPFKFALCLETALPIFSKLCSDIA